MSQSQAAEPHTSVRFTTKLEPRWVVSDTPLDLPTRLSRYGLSEVVSHLLGAPGLRAPLWRYARRPRDGGRVRRVAQHRKGAVPPCPSRPPPRGPFLIAWTARGYRTAPARQVEQHLVDGKL